MLVLVGSAHAGSPTPQDGDRKLATWVGRDGPSLQGRAPHADGDRFRPSLPPVDLWSRPSFAPRLPREWVVEDGELNWLGQFVAVGNGGRHAFAFYFLNNTGAALYPVENDHPPTASWEIFSDTALMAQPVGVAAAKAADVFVALTETPDAVDPAQRSLHVRKYSVLGGEDWAYLHPHPVPPTASRTAGPIGVSNDGTTIVATARDPVAQEIDVLVFDPSHDEPIAVHHLPGNFVWQFDLSADGRVVLLGVDTYLYLMETDTGTLRHAQNLFTVLSSNGMTLSGDGSVFARGLTPANGSVKIYRWDEVAAVYQEIHTVFSPIGGMYGSLELSEDGSTLAAGINVGYFDVPNTVARIEAIDVDTGIVTLGETVQSPYPDLMEFQNVVLDVAISANGSRLVAALAGDSEFVPPAQHEIRIYDARHDTLLATRNLPGSALDVDISSDGSWVVFGSKAVHINQLGNGGKVGMIRVR